MNYKSILWTRTAQGHPDRATAGKLDEPLADLSLAQFFHSLFSVPEVASNSPTCSMGWSPSQEPYGSSWHQVVWAPAAEHQDPTSRRYTAEKYKAMFLSADPHKRQWAHGPNGQACGAEQGGMPAPQLTAQPSHREVWPLPDCTHQPGQSPLAALPLALCTSVSPPSRLAPRATSEPICHQSCLSSAFVPFLPLCGLSHSFLPAVCVEVAQLSPIRAGP